MQHQMTVYKTAASAIFGVVSYLSLTFALVYLPLSSALLVRVGLIDVCFPSEKFVEIHT